MPMACLPKLAGDTEFLHAGLQRRTLQAEAMGRTIGSADHAVRLAEDAEDVFALGILQAL